MNAREYILSKRVPKFNEVTLDLADGVSVTFRIPLSGVLRSSLERKCLTFSKAPANGVFVAKGLMPPEGFDENISYGLMFLAETNQEGWTQQDVLELYDASPDEILAMFSKLIQVAGKAQAEAESKEVEDELKNSEAIQPTDG